MLSGASQADIAILVISARKGEFETGFEKGGQTREHALLVKTNGVKRLIVVVNKMDEPSVQWSEERYREIVDKLTPFLKRCGYRSDEMTFIPIAGLSGQNMKEPVPSSICPWFKGPSFLQFLDEMAPIERNTAAPFMMPISEKYKEMGTVVAGKIETGTIRRGQMVMVMPNKNLVEIIAIYDEDEEIAAAQCGDNVKLKLKGIDDEEISVGFVLCSAENPVKVASAFDAQIIVEEIRNIISPGYTAVMHVHTCTEEVSIKVKNSSS
jgi:peptide chain release factor subunit 3